MDADQIIEGQLIFGADSPEVWAAACEAHEAEARGETAEVIAACTIDMAILWGGFWGFVGGALGMLVLGAL